MLTDRFRSLISDPHKKEIINGALESIFIKVLGMLIGYVFIIFLARTYGANVVGTYQIALQFVAVMATISLLGFNQSIVKFTSELVVKNNIKELISLQFKFSLIAFIASFVLVLFTYYYSETLAITFLKDKKLSIIFQLLSFILPFFTLNLLFVETIRGLKKIKTSELLRLFSVRFFNLIIFVIALIFIDFNDALPIISFEVAVFFSFLFATYFVCKNLKDKLSFHEEPAVPSSNKYISTSLTMYQSNLLLMLSNQALVFLLAYFAVPTEVGVYNVAFQIANLTAFVFSAVTTIVAPKYSELFHGDKEDFHKAIIFSTKIVFWSAGLIALVTILFSYYLMMIFGDEFLAGQNILIVLSIANFINAFTGSSGVLLDMVGKHRIRRNLLVLNSCVTLIASLILIPLYGGLGLAFSILINMVLGNFFGVFYVYKHLGVNMIYLPLITKG